jgi:transposase
LPLFFTLSPGDVREVKTLELALLSAGIKNAIIVGDKGFTSRLNIEIIESNDISYILPLKRNDSFVDYTDIIVGKTAMKSFFKFKDRYIWYITKTIGDNKRVIVFLDDQLRIAEEHDYLDRIEKYPDNYSIETFHIKQSSMGTIATIDNLPDKAPKEIYQTYKSRCEIEQLFDIFKNELEADKTYMHSIESLRGWMFINHLALIAYYKIYLLLQSSSLLDKYSVNDILENLYHINMVFLGNQWKLQTISVKTEKLLRKINVKLPITWIWES